MIKLAKSFLFNLKPCESVYYKIFNAINQFTIHDILVDSEQFENDYNNNNNSKHRPLSNALRKYYSFDDGADEQEVEHYDREVVEKSSPKDVLDLDEEEILNWNPINRPKFFRVDYYFIFYFGLNGLINIEIFF